MSSDELNKVKPVVFPLIWLTYKQRIRRDLDRAYATDEGEAFFNQDYFSRLSTQAKQLDEVLIKLLLLQFALSAFQMLGFFGGDASLSLFGVTLKQATGIKEVLLLLYALVALATWTITISRDTSLAVLERLAELTTEEHLSGFGKLAAPTFFGVKVYVPRAYDDWIFPTLANRALFWAVSLLATLLFFAVIAFSLVVNILFVVDIYQHPTLGGWSKWILAFVGLTFLFGLLFILRFYFPLPHRDQSSLLALKALEQADIRLSRRLRAEIFGEDSRYRKYTWRHHGEAALAWVVALKKNVAVKLRCWITRLSRQ
jgi:hypothetical protein